MRINPVNTIKKALLSYQKSRDFAICPNHPLIPVVLLVVVMVTGCGPVLEIHVNSSVPQVVGFGRQRLPGTVAILLPASSPNYIVTRTPDSGAGSGRIWRFYIGQALREASRNAFAQVFENAEDRAIDDLGSASRVQADYLCCLSIKKLYFAWPGLLEVNARCCLEVEFKLIQPDGVVLLSETVWAEHVSAPCGMIANGNAMAEAANAAIVRMLREFIAKLEHPDVLAYANEIRARERARAIIGWSAPDSLEGMANILNGVARSATADTGNLSINPSDIDQAVKQSGLGLAKLIENPSSLISVVKSLKCRYLLFGKIEPEGEQVRLTAFLFDRKSQSVVNSVTRKERMDDIPTLQEAVRTMVAELNRSRNLPQR
jgi:hypothetical protein